MKTVVFACLGILLMILSLGFGYEASGPSNDELVDNVDQVRIVRRNVDAMSVATVSEREEFSHTCPPNTRFGAFKATWGFNHCFWDVSARVHFECFGKKVCRFPVTNTFFEGDPCHSIGRKYVDIHYRCWPTAQLDALQPVHAHQDHWMTLHCPPNEAISIVLAEYGWGTCSKDVKEKVTELCKGKRVCSIKATNENFGNSCPNYWKMLDVYYKCDVRMNENKRCWPKVAERRRLIKSPRIYASQEITLTCPSGTKFGVVDVYFGAGQCYEIGLKVVDEKCFGKTSCRVAVNHRAIQPHSCSGTHKYMDVTYGCWPSAAQLKRIKASRKWENQNLVLSCASDEKIEVVLATYGNYFMCYNTYDVFPAMDDWCSGKQRCAFTVTNTNLKTSDPCLRMPKILLVTYRCWPKEYWVC